MFRTSSDFETSAMLTFLLFLNYLTLRASGESCPKLYPTTVYEISYTRILSLTNLGSGCYIIFYERMDCACGYSYMLELFLE